MHISNIKKIALICVSTLIPIAGFSLFPLTYQYGHNGRYAYFLGLAIILIIVKISSDKIKLLYLILFSLICIFAAKTHINLQDWSEADTYINEWLKVNPPDKLEVYCPYPFIRSAFTLGPSTYKAAQIFYWDYGNGKINGSLRERKNTKLDNKNFDIDQNYSIGDILDTLKIESIIKLLSTRISESPQSADLYNQRGNLYVQLGNYRQAFSDYTNSIKLNPNHYNAICNRANIYSLLGHDDNAIINYTKALKICPDHYKAVYNRGLIYSKHGEYDKSIEDFNYAINIKPTFVNAYVGRGVSFAKKGNLDLALEDLNAAIDIDPNNEEAYYNRGMVFKLRNEIQKSEQDFDMAIRLRNRRTK